MPNTLARPAIPAILSQHLEEAAFCWLRRQGGLWSPAFKAEHVRRFDLLLDAHLEGLRVAGNAAVAPALESLAKWKTPDEAFVSTYVLAHAPDAKTQTDLEALILENPEMAPGASAALLWSTPETASGLVKAWGNHAEGLLRRVALPAALREAGNNPGEVINAAVREPATRSRALRACAEFRIQHPFLQQGLQDADPEVRLEAILALVILGHANTVEALPELLPALRPTALKRALLIWGWAAPDAAFQKWMEDLDPATIRMRLWAAAFRGDSAWIPFLSNCLEDSATAMLAAYALGHITGMDVDLESLDKRDSEESFEENETTQQVETESEEEAPAEKEHPDDIGLLQPDPEKVRKWLSKHAHRFPRGGRFLAGGSPNEIPTILTTGTQPQRWQAAFLLAQKGQPDTLRNFRNPSLTPNLAQTIELIAPKPEGWKTAMMRGIEWEKARKEALSPETRKARAATVPLPKPVAKPSAEPVAVPLSDSATPTSKPEGWKTAMMRGIEWEKAKKEALKKR